MCWITYVLNRKLLQLHGLCPSGIPWHGFIWMGKEITSEDYVQMPGWVILEAPV